MLKYERRGDAKHVHGLAHQRLPSAASGDGETIEENGLAEADALTLSHMDRLHRNQHVCTSQCL